MLVLSRRTNEEITFPVLGISVEVLRIEGGKVRLGIRAPRSVRVLRGELDFKDEWDNYEIQFPLNQVANQLAKAS
jgi:carbon storage regulator CsrA